MPTTTTTEKLVPTIKERWIAALRSGEYQQGKGSLHSKDGAEDRFCCLGVLCELAVEDGVVDRNDPGDAYVYYDGMQGMPSSRVRAWAFGYEGVSDIPWRVPVPGDPARVTSLDSLNDSGKAFDEIADVIEREL